MRLFALTLAAGALVALVAVACSDDENGSSSGNVAPDGSTSGNPDGQSSGDLPDGQSSGTSATSGHPPSADVQYSEESMQVNGENRTYVLAVPTKYDANKKYPLVMVLHGNPGDAKGLVANLPFHGASKQDAILAY